MILKNYTPHEVTFFCDDKLQVAYQSEGVARVTENIVGDDGFFVEKCYGEITGLPAPQDGVLFIVSIVVAQANKEQKHPRVDLVSPDTGTFCVRDSSGEILGTKRWVI